MTKVKSWLSTKKVFFYPLLAFSIPFLTRTIPELLMGPFVTGFDTLGYYVPNTLLWLRHGVSFSSFIAVAPFLYVLLMSVTSIGVPIVALVKVVSPLLLGFLGTAVYYYANTTLSWSPKKSLLVVLVATLYFVALRVSFDMLRSELALIFLFATLIFLKKDGAISRNGVLLSLSMLSVVFAHQLVAVIMFVIVLATIARLYLDKNMIGFRRLVVCSIPAGIMFSAIIYADYLTSSQFSVVSSFLGQGSEGFAALFGFASHADLITDTLGFLVFCYLPLTPLLLLGTKRFKNNLQLKVWVLLILIMLLSVIISPNAFFAVFPYRWTLLLVYPLAFYVTEGFAGLGSNLYKVCVGLMLTTLSLGFVALPNNSPFPYYGAYQLYMPTSMLQNTVPMVDCQSTTNALLWLENNMNENARLLAHRAFFGWALLTLNESQIELYEYGNPSDAARTLVQQGIGQVYLVWWTNGTGWHGQQNVSSSFEEVYHSDRIAVYRYSGSM